MYDFLAVGTFQQAQLLSYQPEIVRIRTNGFLLDGDGGAAFYDRWIDTVNPLPVDGRGIWWFEAFDTSCWQIAAAAEHNAQQFGALGGLEIDAGPILNAAFSASMVQQIRDR